MSLATLLTRASLGVEAPLIHTEVDLANGLPAFNIVGLPDAAVREARDRVRSALINSGFEFPAKRITVNLAPADLPKDGGRFDLAIALGIIAACGLIKADTLAKTEFFGELSLTGAIRPVTGAIPFAMACKAAGHRAMLCPDNAAEAALVDGLTIVAPVTLLEAYHHLGGQQPLLPFTPSARPLSSAPMPDLQDVRGQKAAKRALEIAAAGGHNLLMCGPPGTGKSMLAQRLPGLLPPMDNAESLETAALYSVAGLPVPIDAIHRRPFRSPHHSCSAVALVGGGSHPRPGEISLAHNGVLFLDELPEFPRQVLDMIREPLETGCICISRAARQASFPCQFQLLAAMNPSPTGALNDGRSTTEQISRYLNRLSGPFLDRVDLQVEVPLLPRQSFAKEINDTGESSAIVRTRVVAARKMQISRQHCTNARLQGKALEQHGALSKEDERFLHQALQSLGLSLRAYHRILRVARTIADLAGQHQIKQPHLLEAMSYRALDKIIKHLSC